MRTPSSKPEWIDVSPDAPGDTRQVEPTRDRNQAAEEKDARWARHWSTLKLLLFVAAAIGATRWITWRQSVMHEPPIQIASSPTPVRPEGTSAAVRVPPSTSIAPTPVAKKRVTVHVVGLVRKPGVIEMGEGARLKDAIFQAGGTLPNADLEAINLAEPLEDGQQYRVTAKGQSTPQVLGALAPRSKIARVERMQAEAQGKPAPLKPSTRSQKAPSAPIDLNRADATQLQDLPGVGPATAQKIIEFRDEVGGFKSVDDLDDVKGIGPKKLEKIRPFAVVR